MARFVDSHIRLIHAAGAALIACAASAQDSPTRESEVDGSIATRIELGLPRISGDAPPVYPISEARATHVTPGLVGVHDWASALNLTGGEMPTPSVLPEGTVLRDRIGSVWKATAGIWVFIPSKEDRSPGEGAMFIAPSTELDRLVTSFNGLDGSIPAALSGVTLFYHGHNYLLLTNATRLQQSPARVASEDPAPTDPQQAPATRDPEVDKLIAELQGESRAETRRSDAMRERLLSADRARSDDMPAGGAAPLLADGTYISQRRARLERHGSGQWLLRFDGDTHHLGDGSLIVIPCRILMLMEARIASRPGASIIVSGRVYSSNGRGYFLPTMFQFEPPSDVKPLQ